jgi:ribosome-binding factor A
MRGMPEELKHRRHHRVVELLRQELSMILRRSVKDPRLNLLTINEINLKADLRSATVSVSRMISTENEVVSTEEQAEILKGLNSASHFIYEQLKKRLVMKVIPSLKFVYDTRLDGLSRIWHLISEVQANDKMAQRENELVNETEPSETTH